MTSKFETPKIRLRPPSWCKKGIPPIAQPTYPVTLLSSWFRFNGHDTNGDPADVNATLTLTYAFIGVHTWQTTFNTGDDAWTFAQFWNQPTNAYVINAQLTRASPGFVSIALAGWQPRSVDPYDSGVLSLTVIAGSGVAAARILF